MNCYFCNPDPMGDVQCDILARTMIYEVHDEKYPKEWITLNGESKCMRHRKWDWISDGDPYDESNVNHRPVAGPNQIPIFDIGTTQPIVGSFYETQDGKMGLLHHIENERAVIHLPNGGIIYREMHQIKHIGNP